MYKLIIFLLYVKNGVFFQNFKIGVSLLDLPNIKSSLSVQSVGGAINVALRDCKEDGLIGIDSNIRYRKIMINLKNNVNFFFSIFFFTYKLIMIINIIVIIVVIVYNNSINENY